MLNGTFVDTKRQVSTPKLNSFPRHQSSIFPQYCLMSSKEHPCALKIRSNLSAITKISRRSQTGFSNIIYDYHYLSL